MLTRPYPIGSLADRLKISFVTWDANRSDELSGTGDGRVWQSELAPSLWSADVKIALGYHDEVKQVAALIRKLYGAQESFYLFDPISQYPQSDPTGSIIGASTVQIHGVGSGRASVRLKGLPAGYVLTLADKFQITTASRYYFAEVSETITADGSGVTPEFEVFPHVPLSVAANDAVNLKKPACLMFIMPGSFNPGTASGLITEGASFKAMERRR